MTGGVGTELVDVTWSSRFVSGTLMGDPLVMVSLYPEFPESVSSKFTTCGEFVFLLDRSGSMDFPMYCGSHQNRIASAKVIIRRNVLILQSYHDIHVLFLFP